MKRYKVIDTDCESDVWFDDVENKILDYKDIEKILEKQDIKWQELKEWLKNQITDLRHIEIKTKTQSLRVNDAVNCFRQVLGQMQELEGDDE